MLYVPFNNIHHGDGGQSALDQAAVQSPCMVIMQKNGIKIKWKEGLIKLIVPLIQMAISSSTFIFN